MLTSDSNLKLNEFFKKHKLHKYKKRDMILHANDISSSVFYIETGYIRVFRISEQGEELTLTILKPKDFFPLTYGLNTTPNPYYLEAITPLEFWRAPQELFTEFIKSNPEVYIELTNRILIRLDGVMNRIEYLVFSNAYTKIAATLLVCAKKFGEINGDSALIQVPLTHKDIATMVGITRETTSLEMKKLEHAGFVRRSGRYLVIQNIKRFEQEVLSTNGDDTPLHYSL